MSYPMFVPPSDILDIHPKERTNDQAKQYYTWLTDSMENRIANLLKYFNFPISDVHNPEILRKIGEKITEAIRSGALELIESTDDVKKESYSIAVDIGLLIAKQIIFASDGQVQFTILKGRKTEFSYNLPALQGFKNSYKGDYVEPIHASIISMIHVLNKGPDRWFSIFESAKARL